MTRPVTTRDRLRYRFDATLSRGTIGVIAWLGLNTAAGWSGTSTNAAIGALYDSNALVYQSPTFAGASIALGPVLGGVLVAEGGWRAIFWFNVVLGAVILAAAARFVPESADPAGRMLDLPGLVLGAVALTGITFAVIEGETLIEADMGFEIDEAEVAYWGRCPDCRSQVASPGTDRTLRTAGAPDHN